MGEDQSRSEDLDSRNHITQLLKLLGCQDLINAKQAHIEYRANIQHVTKPESNV